MLNFINKKFEGKTFADVCCGIGGFRLALESMGTRCVFSSEIDKFARAVYKENYGELPSGDITKIDTKVIPDHDILCAGFPCQPFSISGKQEGFKDITRGTIFFDILRIIEDKRPEVVFLENVANLVSHDNGNTFSVIKNSIEALEYDFHYAVLNAADYGVPQARNRLYMVALRKDIVIKNFVFPSLFELTKHIDDILEPASDITTEMYVNRTYAVMNGKVEEYINRPIQIGYINKNRQGERIYSTKGTAVTLTANGGGKFSKTGGYLIDGKIRKLTPRECARLMGFPDEFKICESNNQAYKQFGNSVVVDVIQYILLSVVDAMNEEKENKIENNSTLKNEYLNPAEKNLEFFDFLSSFKVVDINYIIRLVINKLNACFNHKTPYKTIRWNATNLIRIKIY